MNLIYYFLNKRRMNIPQILPYLIFILQKFILLNKNLHLFASK